VRVDDVELTRASFGSALPLEPGDHEIIVRVPGRQNQRQTVTLKERDIVDVTVPLQDQPTATGGGTPRAPFSAAPSGGDDQVLGMNRSTSTWVALGVGGAGLLVGTVAGLVGLKQESIADLNCNDDTMLTAS
jgi:hypothetical protein